MRPRIRLHRDGDLGRIVGLCQREGLVPEGPDGLTIDDVADLIASPATETLLAEVDGELVGFAVGSATGTVGSIYREFLRQLPRMRESFNHLLVCATNSVGSLDPAFLRPGRFDYVVPAGPPDARARASIWHRYISDITDEDVDVDALVAASDRFTPADIEFAARKAAQLAFESEHSGHTDRRAGTQQFVAAIRETRPTLTDEMIATFERDVERYARY